MGRTATAPGEHTTTVTSTPPLWHPYVGVTETRKAPSNEGALHTCRYLLQEFIARNSKLNPLLLRKVVRMLQIVLGGLFPTAQQILGLL